MLRQYFHAMLAELRRRTARAALGATEFDRRADPLVPVQFGDHLPVGRCGAAVASSTGSTGPAGTPARINRNDNSFPSCSANAAANAKVKATRLAFRSPLLAKRGSSAISGRPISSHSFRNCPLLPLAMKISHVLVGYLSYGTRFGCGFPVPVGRLPLRKKFAA